LFWYRAVQEALGVCLVLTAIYFATDYVVKKENPKRLFWSGLFLGLALATKYTFFNIGCRGSDQRRIAIDGRTLAPSAFCDFRIISATFVAPDRGNFYRIFGGDRIFSCYMPVCIP